MAASVPLPWWAWLVPFLVSLAAGEQAGDDADGLSNGLHKGLQGDPDAAHQVDHSVTEARKDAPGEGHRAYGGERNGHANTMKTV